MMEGMTSAKNIASIFPVSFWQLVPLFYYILYRNFDRHITKLILRVKSKAWLIRATRFADRLHVMEIQPIIIFER